MYPFNLPEEGPGIFLIIGSFFIGLGIAILLRNLAYIALIPGSMTVLLALYCIWKGKNDNSYK